jgi:GNAT superfamily N-acetyltransferase
LLDELWRELDELYGNDAATTWHVERMQDERAVFVLARLDNEPVGCGAIRPLTETIAEVKRVFVQPHARRHGVARRIVETLEQLARARGFSEIWLETGLPQTAALQLYESLGYTRIADFGEYKDEPLSVCYGKRLT